MEVISSKTMEIANDFSGIAKSEYDESKIINKLTEQKLNQVFGIKYSEGSETKRKKPLLLIGEIGLNPKKWPDKLSQIKKIASIYNELSI